MTSATGVNTAKKITAMTTGLTTRLRSSPNFIQAYLRGASQWARVTVTTAKAAPTAIIQGWEIAPARKNRPANVQPNLRSDGIRAVVMAGAKITRALGAASGLEGSPNGLDGV